MQLQVSKWGNSLAVRLPSAITKQLHIADGDSVDLSLNNLGELVLTPAKVFDKTVYMAQLNKHTKQLPQSEPILETMRKDARY